MTLLGLGLAGWLTISVVVGATALMAMEKGGPDLVMFSGLSVLVVGGVLTPAEALVGFARPEVATIAVLFVVAAAVGETGALRLVSQVLFGKTQSPGRALLRLVVPTAVLSAFLNNTPIVVMFIPVVRAFALRIGQSPSRFLIPLSYAAMLGGTCTLIGTAANLVVSGFLVQQGLEPLGMFELSWIGVPTAIAGIIYLTTVGKRLLKPRLDPMDIATEQFKEYLAEVEVIYDSPLVGRTVEANGLRSLPGLFLVEIRRGEDERIAPVAPEHLIEGGDHLVFTGDASTIIDLKSFPGLVPTQAQMGDEELYEVVISHSSPLIGRTVRGAEFRRRFDAAILAVNRAGERIEGKIGDIILSAGDTLILTAAPGFRRTWRHSEHFYLVSEVPTEAAPRYRKAPLALGSIAIMVLLPSIFGMPMLISAMMALLVLLATRCITPRAARAAVNWQVLVLISSAIGVAAGLEKSGAAGLFGNLLAETYGVLGARGLLVVLYVTTVALACFISNVAAAAFVFPVAMTAAASAGLDPRPFAIALALAASAAFATPIGYQANLLVQGPGGYRYLDFTRVGLPLNVVLLAIAATLIPVFWPLQVL